MKKVVVKAVSLMIVFLPIFAHADMFTPSHRCYKPNQLVLSNLSEREKDQYDAKVNDYIR